MRRVLRFAIILLGLQLTAAQVDGGRGEWACRHRADPPRHFLFTTWLGRLIGVKRGLAELIAAGTSICGASAVIATNTVTRAHDEDVAYAVACVTVFGSIAMFLYPLLPDVLGLAPHAYGLWAGASIREIAQVVAAAYQDGAADGEFGTIAKLSRVMLLAPMVIALGFAASRRAAHRWPWRLPPRARHATVRARLPRHGRAQQHGDHAGGAEAAIVLATTFLLSMALAAMGQRDRHRQAAGQGRESPSHSASPPSPSSPASACCW